MEVIVTRRMPQSAWRRWIARRYRTARALRAADAAGDGSAREARAMLALFEERESPEETEWTSEAHVQLAPSELRLLTPCRLEILVRLQEGDGGNVSALAKVLGRDKKNVSLDLHALERLGLVDLERRGREAIPVLYGTEIRFVLGPSAAAQRAGKRGVGAFAPAPSRSQARRGRSGKAKRAASTPSAASTVARRSKVPRRYGPREVC